MRTFVTALTLAGLIAVAGCSQPATQPASAGPNGGDVVPIQGGNTYAELLTNVDTGEVLVQTWDRDLKTRRPIENEPITVGSGDKSVELAPHPVDTDPPGTCSRFHGAAGWVRGGASATAGCTGAVRAATRSSPGSAAGKPGARTAPCGRRWVRTGAWGRCTGPATMTSERRIGPASRSHDPESRATNRRRILSTTGDGVLRRAAGAMVAAGRRPRRQRLRRARDAQSTKWRKPLGRNSQGLSVQVNTCCDSRAEGRPRPSRRGQSQWHRPWRHRPAGTCRGRPPPR